MVNLGYSNIIPYYINTSVREYKLKQLGCAWCCIDERHSSN